LKSPDLMISLGCAVRKGSGLAAVLTSGTGLQNVAYCATDGDRVCEWWTERSLSYRYILTGVLASVKIHFVVFRVMTLCIVVYCYGASAPREYSLPKCWYPPVITLYRHNRISEISVPRYLFLCHKITVFVSNLDVPSNSF
jgi:hypothetical protein